MRRENRWCTVLSPRGDKTQLPTSSYINNLTCLHCLNDKLWEKIEDEIKNIIELEIENMIDNSSSFEMRLKIATYFFATSWNIFMHISKVIISSSFHHERCITMPWHVCWIARRIRRDVSYHLTICKCHVYLPWPTHNLYPR